MTAAINVDSIAILQRSVVRIHEIVKEEQTDLAVGTGLERRARWISAKGGQTSDSSPVARNTANAIATATTHAAKVNPNNNSWNIH